MHCRIGCLPKKSSISLSTKNRSPNQRASKCIIATSSAVYGCSQQVFSLLGISLLRGIDRIICIYCVYDNWQQKKPYVRQTITSMPTEMVEPWFLSAFLTWKVNWMCACSDCQPLSDVNTRETHYGAVGQLLLALRNCSTINTDVFFIFPTTLV